MHNLLPLLILAILFTGCGGGGTTDDNKKSDSTFSDTQPTLEKKKPEHSSCLTP